MLLRIILVMAARTSMYIPQHAFSCAAILAQKPNKSITVPLAQNHPRPRSRSPKHQVFQPKLTTIVSQDPNAELATRPSPAPWADGPYELIRTDRRREQTGAVYCAAQMASVHNMILRGLNSILRQAQYVPDASKPRKYVPKGVQDLLIYVHAWAKTLEHHHDTEENIFFPLVEEETGIVGLMDDLEVEHEEFHDGLIALRNYLARVIETPRDYRWKTMRTIINGFAPALTNHLYAEIDFLLAMEKFNSDGLRRCWDETEKAATRVEDSRVMYDMFPFILGNCDRTYEGGNSFPEMPKAMRYGIKHWFSKRHQGAWRFNCCDFSGRPVPLQMLPENRE